VQRVFVEHLIAEGKLKEGINSLPSCRLAAADSRRLLGLALSIEKQKKDES